MTTQNFTHATELFKQLSDLELSLNNWREAVEFSHYLPAYTAKGVNYRKIDLLTKYSSFDVLKTLTVKTIENEIEIVKTQISLL